MYVESVLVTAVYAPVKIESIADPSVFVTLQVKVPQFAVKPPTLDVAESVQVKSVDVFLTLYVKAGEGKAVALIFRESEGHGF